MQALVGFLLLIHVIVYTSFLMGLYIFIYLFVLFQHCIDGTH